jgi:hypothetical protein
MAGAMGTNIALDGGGNVVLQNPVTPTDVQTSISGGGGNTAQASAPIAPGGDFQGAAKTSLQTLDAVNRLTQGALTPYVQAEQKRMYFDGMSQVAQGRALQQIEKEQPWYTKIFGPSATIQGAQAMTASTAISQAQTEFMGALPSLREQDPNTVRQFLVDQAARIGNTGDPLVDGIVQSKLAEQWGPMLETHMKQHYAWQQDQAGKSFVNMQVSQGSLLQSTLHAMDGFSDPDQAKMETDKFTAGLTRPYGMTDEAYGKYMALSARANLSNGNFAAYEAMKNNGDVWNSLPMDARIQLENEEELWTQKSLKNSPALTDISSNKTKLQLALQQGVFPGSEADLNKVMDQMDADLRSKTGSTVPLFNNPARDAMLRAYYAGKQKMSNAVNKAQMDLLSDQAQRGFAMGAYTAGSSAAMPHGVSEENAQLAAEEFWTNGKQAAQQDPATLDNTLLKLAQTSDEPKLRPNSLTVQLQQDLQNVFVTGGKITDRAQQSLQIAQGLLKTPSGPQALTNYLGDGGLAAKVQAFLGSGADISDPKDLEAKRSWIKQGTGASVDTKDVQAATDAIGKQDPGFMKRYLLPVFGGPGELSSYALNDASKEKLAQNLAPYVAMTRKAFAMDYTKAAQFAFSQVYGNQQNTDFIDGTIVGHNPYIPGAQSLYQGVRQLPGGGGVNQANEDYQQAVRDALHENMRTAVSSAVTQMNAQHANDPLYVKGDPDHFDVDKFQAVGGEQVGAGVLMVYYQNKDNPGTVYPVLVRPDQVIAKYKQHLGGAEGKQELIEGLQNNPMTQNGIGVIQ